MNDGTYAGAAVASTRVPQHVVINSAAGPVHCRFFWHAQSANNGAIVAQM
jgi:hypothetical protein